MSNTYKSWDERHAEAQMTKAQADKLTAEAAKEQVETKRLAAQAELDQVKVAAEAETVKLAESLKQTKMRARLAEIETAEADAEAERKKRKAEERADRGDTVRGLIVALVAVTTLGALPSQVTYFLTLHEKGTPAPSGWQHLSWATAFVPFALEMMAWGMVLLGNFARRKGLPKWPFWILAGALAGYAGWINLSHGTTEWGPTAGWALAACSVVGPIVWEAYEYVTERPKMTPPTDAELAAARKEEADRKAQAATDARRKKLHAEEFEVFQSMLAANRPGYMPREEVWEEARRAVAFPREHQRFEELLLATGSTDRRATWAAAWADIHRAAVGDTVSTWQRRVEADAELENVLTEARDHSVYREIDAFLLDTFRGDDDAGGSAPRAIPGGPSGGPAGATAEGAGTLDQKGRAATGAVDGRDAGRVPAEADIRKVLKIAQRGKTFPGVGRIRSEAGVAGGTEYLMRVRDAAKSRFGR